MASVVTVRLHHQRRLRVVVRYADTGAVKVEFTSPFQKSAYRAIRILVLDSDGDGVPTQVVLLGRKGKKTFRRVLLP